MTTGDWQIPNLEMSSREMPEVLRARIVLDQTIDGGGVGSASIGRLGNALVRVIDRNTGPAFLKVGRGAAAAELGREAAVLEWIGTRLPVPKMVLFVGGDPTYLLLSALPGKPSNECIDELGPAAVVRAFATTLRSIHALAIDDCPCWDLFADELAEADARVRGGAVDRDSFLAATGMTPTAALDWLSQLNLPSRRTEVFTHGDFCMPNVLIDDGEVSGIVDWGRAGVANPNRDFMSVGVTLGLNLDLGWRAAFFDEYGADRLDEEMVRVYYVLDQFF